MNKFLRLFRFKMMNQYGLSGMKASFASPRKKMTSIAILLFVLLIAALIVFSYIIMMSVMYMTFKEAGEKELYLNFTMLFAQFVSLFVIIMSSFNTMFNGKEQELFRPLPIKREHIFMTSYVVMYVSALISTLVIIIPAAGVYQYYEGFSPAFTAEILFGAIWFPALPCMVATFLMFGIMMISGRFRHKELISTILGLLLLIACFVLYSMFSSGGTTVTQDDISGVLLENSGIIKNLSKYMVNIYAYRMLLGGGVEFFIGTGILLALFAVTMPVIYFPGSRLFEKVTEMLQHSAGSKIKSQKNYSRSSVKTALLKKEFRLLFRSPVYMFNCMINVIIGPILIIILGMRTNGMTSKGDDIISMITQFLEKNINAQYVVVGIITAVTMAISTMSMVASTSVSREGRNYMITQIIPVSYKDQIKAKITCSLILNLVCVITMMAIGGVLLELDILPVIIGVVICIIALFSYSYIGAFIDVMRPKIHWTKEAEAVKQNVNGMIALLLCVILTIFYIIPMALYLLGIISDIVLVVALTILIEVVALIVTRIMLYRLIKSKEIYR